MSVGYLYDAETGLLKHIDNGQESIFNKDVDILEICENAYKLTTKALSSEYTCQFYVFIDWTSTPHLTFEPRIFLSGSESLNYMSVPFSEHDLYTEGFELLLPEFIQHKLVLGSDFLSSKL